MEYFMNLPISENTIESGCRVIKSLLNKEYKKQVLTNDAIPYEQKETSYLLGFCRMVECKNFRYIVECEGTEP